MIVNVSYDFHQANEYKYYHLCILHNQKVVTTLFDLSFELVKIEIEKYKNLYEFIVIGTIENIDSCIRFINSTQYSDILFCDLKKEDVFKSKNSIFVDLTEYFKNVKH